jgi:hypothetical protein
LINHWLLSMISFCLRVISVIFLISMHLTGSTWHLGHQSSFRNIAIVINDFQKYKAIFSDFFSGILTIETQNLGNYFHNNQFPAYIFQTFLWQFWIPRFLNFSSKSSHLRYWRVKIFENGSPLERETLSYFKSHCKIYGPRRKCV